MFFGLNKKRICPIGVDLGKAFLRMAQLGLNGHQPSLLAAGLRAKPADIQAGSPAWQRWAVEAIKEIYHQSGFKSRQVVTALSSDDVFIDLIKVPRSGLDNLEQAALPKAQKRLPFEPQQAVIQYVPAEHSQNKSPDVDVLVIAAQRETVNRHLAIYEYAGLEVVGITIWPNALIQSYVHFFCRREEEQSQIAMLLDVGSRHTNVVICRGPALLFARIVSIGYIHLSDTAMLMRLMSELEACVRYYESMSGNAAIERMVFLSGSGIDAVLCDRLAELARQMQVAAQIGDVVCAVEMSQTPNCLIDRRNNKIDWATAFGLSLYKAQ